MSMEVLIDIVIPIYNAEKHIPNLIRELENQSIQCFRAIFVDDGSTDRSYEVLTEQLCGKSFSYEIIRQKNSGAAAARNTGLRETTAPWITFIDCDDSVKPYFLEYQLKAATESGADLSVCGYQTVPEGEALPECPEEELKFRAITPAECMNMYCTNWLGVYCLMISGEMLRGKHLLFDEKCSYCEDAPYIAYVIEACEKVSLVELPLYYYRVNVGSLSRSPRLEKYFSGIDAFERMIEDFKARDSEAAQVFLRLGSVRYYLAVLRKAAVQMSYRDFCELAGAVRFRQYRSQVSCLTGTQRLASYVLLMSRTLFYLLIRLIFKD